ncbi:PD-(D/E)XK nuclease family protein [Anaeromyxobacter oryzisoli]|uniref:PD-(D/E)XK nuclease family protein n=1 Tax=Anaeromyxobacter oryzisoli TaxID=2925408 RepID=UPI001F560CFF|nr:PD-(D/E)XK nuclease family protein [Anaeromyxobacter sp. SG63]
MSTVTDPFDLARAEALLRGYDARWTDDMARYEVLAVEAEFTAPVVNPITGAASRTWRLGGKLDALVHDRETSRDIIVEHKTSSVDVGPGSEYWRRLRMDGQVSVYFDGARALGFDPQACLYDVLAKPRQRPLLATPPENRRYTKAGKLDARQREVDETPAEYLNRLLDAIASDPNAFYQRGEVVRLEQEISEAQHDIWQIGKQIRESDLAGRFPRNPDACLRYGSTCAFFDVCTGAGSLDDESRFYRSLEVHPELAGASAELGHGSDLLTASRLSAARACQRLHKLKYADGWRPVTDAEALRFGTLIHRGLEAWWRAPDGDRLEAALAALIPQPEQQHQELAAASF